MHSSLFVKHVFRRSFRYKRVLILLFFISLIIYVYNVFNLPKSTFSSLKAYQWKRDNAINRILLQHTDQVCVHPHLELFPTEFETFYKKLPALDCGVEDNWVYVDNGTFRISKEAEKRNGKIECEYTPVFMGTDDFTTHDGRPIKPMLDGANLVSDFFKVSCLSSTGQRYVNIQSGIAYDKHVHDRLARTSINTGPKYDVLVLGFDSISRMAWQRLLPESHEYFTKHLGGVILEGHNIVGDGTTQALLPMLTGRTEEELPEARRGQPGAQTVDNFPWIWESLKRHGYVTLWNEDMPETGTFHYRMLGFKNQPTDHYMRPFYIAAKEIYFRNHAFCLGSVKRHVNSFNWIRDAYAMYRDTPKFMFTFNSEISHLNDNRIQIIDDDLKQFLSYLVKSGSLDRTILILMADHGNRYSSVRSTTQGKLEERMPYFGIRLPPSFEDNYPHLQRNLRINSERLTTSFDIHATFQDMLLFTNPRKAQVGERGISLFKEIPKERSCRDAHIEPHWCACLSWTRINVNNPISKDGALAVITRINAITSEYRKNCTLLKLYNVTDVMKYSTNIEVLKFKKSADRDGRVADLTGDTSVNSELYQLIFHTRPGTGKFEATIRHFPKDNRFEVSDREISRISKYGMEPRCVMDQHPHLRPYCYCV